MTVDDVQDKLSEEQSIQLTVWGETRSLSLVGQIAVACVIRNRLNLHFRGAKTYRDVCFARLQFSCWSRLGGSVNFDAVIAAAQQVLTLPENRWAVSLKTAQQVARGIISNELTDVTDGATHYYHKSIPPPAWSLAPAVLTKELGGHRFYKNVR